MIDIPNIKKGVRQLFLDDEMIAQTQGMKQVVNQPTRYPENPVIRGEYPWEKASTSVYGTAIYDEEMGRFRLWYLCTPGPQSAERKWVEVKGYRRVTNCTLVAYATSKDGVHWEKPILNQLSFEGSKANNLLDIGIDNPEGISVLYDLHDSDSTRRYKAFFWDRRVSTLENEKAEGEGRKAEFKDKSNHSNLLNFAFRPSPSAFKEPPDLTPTQAAGGLWVAFSADGIIWKTHGPVLPQGSDTTQAVVFDPNLKRYVAFGRFGFGRKVARTESHDFIKWSEPKLVLQADKNDGPGGQIYGMPTDIYEGIYLGMFWMYREGIDGKIDTQLAVSHDGINWKRVADRQTFLPNAPEGGWDDGMSRIVGRYIIQDDKIYLYYSMVNGPHRGPKFPNPVRKFPPAIGLVTLRRDGFVSMDADEDEGSILTKPFVLPANSHSLHLNLDAQGGYIRVAICDVSGKPLSNFETSDLVTGDIPDAVINWKNRVGAVREPPLPLGQTVRLRFLARRAKIYSYWFL